MIDRIWMARPWWAWRLLAAHAVCAALVLAFNPQEPIVSKLFLVAWMAPALFGVHASSRSLLLNLRFLRSYSASDPIRIRQMAMVLFLRIRLVFAATVTLLALLLAVVALPQNPRTPCSSPFQCGAVVVVSTMFVGLLIFSEHALNFFTEHEESSDESAIDQELASRNEQVDLYLARRREQRTKE